MSREANGKTISLYSCIFLEVILFYQQSPDDVRVQELKKRIHCFCSKMLEQVWCYTTTKELNKKRHSYEKLFKHHNTTPSCLSLLTFHRVFLASTLQLLAANRSDFTLLEVSQFFWLVMM